VPLLIWYLDRSLQQSVALAADTEAQQVSNQLAAGGPTAVIRLLGRGRGERSVAQVLDAHGNVVASSAELAGLPPLSGRRPTARGRAHSLESSPDVNEADKYVVVAQGVRSGGQHYVVLVGESLASANRSIRTVETALAVGLPALLLVVGGATFVFVGRSLRPVEAIRARVALLSSQELSERFPEPAVYDEVGRLSVTMNDMLERLQRTQKAQYGFVAAASHELRSPLATLRSTLEVALVHPGTRTTENIEAMLAETERLQRLVDDLVVLARSDERPSTSRSDVDLEDLVQEERHRVHATTSLQVDGSVRPVRVQGNRHQLAQVVRNLVDNAVQQAVERITIDVREEHAAEGPMAVLSVSDDGPGIPAADRERVFERFVRLDTHRSRHDGGSGLGLAIVRQLVLDHGGSVTVDDGPHGGALFVVRLPLRHA
jgi:signal transduction histidine kinase